MPATHRLDADVVHYEWNNAIPPRLLAEPGATLVLDTRDAADGYYTPASTSRDTAARGPFKGHPLTGPVAVKDARPGDVLVVDIVDVRPAEPFGWTHIRPGRGLLPEADFPESLYSSLSRIGMAEHSSAHDRQKEPNIVPHPLSRRSRRATICRLSGPSSRSTTPHTTSVSTPK